MSRLGRLCYLGLNLAICVEDEVLAISLEQL
jgi:hypothetical protein